MKKFLLSNFMLLVLFSACELTQSEQPAGHFTRIYNQSNFSGNFYPIDIIQAADSGYMILGKTIDPDFTFPVTYLLRTDARGNFMWDNAFNPYVNPLPGGLWREENDYFMIVMDDISLEAHVIKVNENNKVAEQTSTLPYEYPLSLAKLETGYLLQYYNRTARNTGMAKLDASFNEEWSQEYPVLEDAEEPIITHLRSPRPILPFFSGQITGTSTYFINGFYNFTLSLIFQNAGTPDAFGVINGFRDKGAISSAQPLPDGEFALSRYNFDDNYILPRQSIEPAGIVSADDLSGFEFPELVSGAHVVTKLIEVTGQNYIIYASSTKSNQIVLLAYDEAGSLVGSRYIGNNYPYEVGNFTLTGDDGLAITGTTYVAGRFPRIALLKLSATDVRELIGWTGE